jgi:phosphatidylserine decarboxylase
MRIAKGSVPWILSTLFVSIVFLILFFICCTQEISIIFLILFLVVFSKGVGFIIFFRDPDRHIGKGITSCADGKIREICKKEDKDIGNSVFISTFMNINNVHVNRMPFDGKVISINHFKGSHVPAYKKESEKNERVITIFNTKIGKMKVVQIAGTIARRIVPYIKKGDELKKGERIGIIRFGSRVDLYIPSKKIIKINVEVKDKIKAGETTIAEVNG